ETSPHAGLGREPLDPEHAVVAVGLHVGAPDEAVAEQEGQHVVAVHALVLALVDLDHVVEAEQAPEERAGPGEVVERAEEGGSGAAAEPGPRGDDDGRPSVVALDTPDEAVADKRVDVRPHFARAAAEGAVLGDTRLGQRPAALDGAVREPAVEAGARRGG